MPKENYAIEMGNLVCKFGSKNLLDYFDTVVHPAFFDSQLVRTYGGKQYFFDKVRLSTVDGRVILVGRFIKDMILEREQVYIQSEGLKHDHEAIQSSPSAIFVLVLDVHRLIYLKETSYAPTIESFKSTIESFIKLKHDHFIDNMSAESIKRGKRITKRQLRLEHLPPSLDIIPLTSARGLRDFIRQYEVLSAVSYKFSDRNDEQDNEGFFRAVQKQKDEVGSRTTTVRHSSPEGLDKDAVIEEVQAATAQGNQKVTMVGKDADGNKISGDNKDFKLKAGVDIRGNHPGWIGRKMFKKFMSLVEDGLIKVDVPGKDVIAKLAKYRDKSK